ncbi:ATP-binding cassette domain-containing protein [Neisseriaceae bacterium PsAf]|nr:ATP-binding cassette domain-containing protein [Neisseriaceae bacterium PsAf]
MDDLQVIDVSVTYPNQMSPTLSEISLTVETNQITVILGPSGCGKTTLLNVLAGFILPNSGVVKLGEKIIKNPDSSRVVVFQDNTLMPWLNVIDNVALGLKIKKIPKQQRYLIAKQLLQQVKLYDVDNKSIWELSGGMKQRVGIARALAVNSNFLLMDEPFGALDISTREQMQDLLLSIWSETQTGIFLITHDIDEALVLADKLILMTGKSGKITETTYPLFSQEWLNKKSIRQIKLTKNFLEFKNYLFEKLFTEN